MVRELMQESLGHMLLISGRSWWWQDGKKAQTMGGFSNDRAFDGTVCAVAFQRAQIHNYGEMLKAAKDALGLTACKTPDNLFI